VSSNKNENGIEPNAHQGQQKVSLQEALARARLLVAENKLPAAEKICNDILNKNAQFHPAYHLLGMIAVKVKKAEIAATMLHKAVTMDTSIALYHRDLADVVCQGGKPKDALVIIERAININPADPHSHYIAGIAHAKLQEYKKSIIAYNKVIELNPNHNWAFNNLGAALEKVGDIHGARNAYARAIDIDPKHPEAQNNLGAILLADGEVKKAKKHFEAALVARPSFVDSHYNLSTLKTYTKDDIHVANLEDLGHQATNLSLDGRIKLCFALAKAREDIGLYPESFDLYKAGNTMKRATFKYNEKNATAVIINIKKLFTKDYFKGYKKNKKDDPTPIFVVGMPRSGSTLIEQILSSHKDVFGAGEVSTLVQCLKDAGIDFSENVEDLEKLSDSALKAIGETYVKKMRALAPDAKRIVDKMPGNFHCAGIIAKILPGAHIIDTARDPVDTCLSNYTRLFNQSMEFAYNLEELGRYYNRYQDLMEHWKTVLPEGILTSVHYESVVGDIEKEARAMINFIGLEWDQNCLEFHKNERAVHTASLAQVRKPIYKTSLQRWRKFTDELKPLRNIVALKIADLEPKQKD